VNEPQDAELAAVVAQIDLVVEVSDAPRVLAETRPKTSNDRRVLREVAQ